MITFDASVPEVRVGKQKAVIRVYYSDRVGGASRSTDIAVFATVVKPELVIEGLAPSKSTDAPVGLGRLLVGEHSRWQFVLRNASDAPAWYQLALDGAVMHDVNIFPSKVSW